MKDEAEEEYFELKFYAILVDSSLTEEKITSYIFSGVPLNHNKNTKLVIFPLMKIRSLP